MKTVKYRKYIKLPMDTKEDMAEELNEILGTSIEWDKLNKDDLELLLELTQDGELIEPMAKHIVSEKGQEALDEKVKDWKPGSILARLM